MAIGRGYTPSSQDKNLSEICDPRVNKYWGTGSGIFVYFIISSVVLLHGAFFARCKKIRN